MKDILVSIPISLGLWLIIISVVLLSGCSSVPVSCANADQARAAATLALRALDRICPINPKGF
ncbi:hypothetical protein [Sphingobium sp. KCTC 72723]|uniref:hypothetical protein n=1 Tax=Sphingobium sp. KCTC 72723 TaxID=2733867 RepID=UPI00165E4C65|nr:hypothetical protein [Sphingobium sp. KCTC 72723]